KPIGQPPKPTLLVLKQPLNRPLDELREMLLMDFAGRTLTMREIYEAHSEDRKYIAKNYKTVLGQLLENGEIEVDRKPRRGSFADTIQVTFPRR
ncbi:MAG: hypothetical protein KJ044_07185, partial [Planctomycetes bacterium]|nr:hypothetical protein [Planctomycetota bacterium]